MTSLRKKSILILENEKRFADILSIQVLASPSLSLWMILIPVIFVFYFFQYQKIRSGRKEFARNYLTSRQRALTEAVNGIETRTTPDIEKLVNVSNLPESAQKAYARWMILLVEHYTELLQANGKNFNALVKSVYKNQTNFLLFLNQLNQLEKKLNVALSPHIGDDAESVKDVVRNIEQFSEKLRRDDAEQIFI